MKMELQILDALTHALEAYASVMATPFTDGLALKSLQLIFENLPAAYDSADEKMGICAGGSALSGCDHL